MAAGLGFKTFTTGEVLTAGDVNGYLMQGINVFATTTARNAAITAPAEGQFAFTKDTNSLWYYDGAAWVASGATGDIEGVTVTSPLTGGGTSGTVTVGILSGTTSNLGAVQLSDSISSTSTTLAATANAVKTAYDNAIPKSLIDAAGDLIVGTAADTAGRLGIGSTGQVLTVSGGTPVWATAAGGSTFSGCFAYSSSDQTIANGTNTFLAWNSESFDVDGYHSTSSNTSRFTIPTGKSGYFLWSMNINWGTNATGLRGIEFFKNGTKLLSGTGLDATSNSPGFLFESPSIVIQLDAGDYVETRVYQTSGGNLDVRNSSFVSIVYLGA